MYRGFIVLKNNRGKYAPRIIAIDYGTKRVGLSIADPLRLFAQPLKTCSPKLAIDTLVSFHKKDTIGVIVVGWPLNEDGSEGEATRLVHQFICRLHPRLPDVKIIRWDERYTSEEAKSRFAWHRKARDHKVDQVAASIILEEYLNSISETTRLD